MKRNAPHLLALAGAVSGMAHFPALAAGFFFIAAGCMMHAALSFKDEQQ